MPQLWQRSAVIHFHLSSSLLLRCTIRAILRQKCFRRLFLWLQFPQVYLTRWANLRIHRSRSRKRLQQSSHHRSFWNTLLDDWMHRGANLQHPVSSLGESNLRPANRLTVNNIPQWTGACFLERARNHLSKCHNLLRLPSTLLLDFLGHTDCPGSTPASPIYWAQAIRVFPRGTLRRCRLWALPVVNSWLLWLSPSVVLWPHASYAYWKLHHIRQRLMYISNGRVICRQLDLHLALSYPLTIGWPYSFQCTLSSFDRYLAALIRGKFLNQCQILPCSLHQPTPPQPSIHQILQWLNLWPRWSH